MLSPDFSIYLEMAPVIQLYNVFRNRWCGAYWASKGMRVIPTVNWGDESTFDFCFDGIEKGSAVAVSTYMASEHGNRQDQKEWFMAGYNEMLRRIEPEKIICYNTPFPEMQGNIIYVDYELSSWKYMSYEKSETIAAEDLDAYKIGGAFQSDCDTMSSYRIGKGGGSAYGGQWRPNPNKPNDQIFRGAPNTVKKAFIPTKKGGFWAKIKYDGEGYASIIRHHSNHGSPAAHSNPHDHIINWIKPDMHPVPGERINYFGGNVPELKSFVFGGEVMETIILPFVPEALQFTGISDFKQSMNWGAEVMFEWKGIEYSAFGKISDSNGSTKMLIGQSGENFTATQKWCSNADEVLEYMVGEDQLRDVITKVEVIERTL